MCHLYFGRIYRPSSRWMKILWILCGLPCRTRMRLSSPRSASINWSLANVSCKSDSTLRYASSRSDSSHRHTRTLNFDLASSDWLDAPKWFDKNLTEMSKFFRFSHKTLPLRLNAKNDAFSSMVQACRTRMRLSSSRSASINWSLANASCLNPRWDKPVSPTFFLARDLVSIQSTNTETFKNIQRAMNLALLPVYGYNLLVHYRNPCVVDRQRFFHRKKLYSLRTLNSSTDRKYSVTFTIPNRKHNYKVITQGNFGMLIATFRLLLLLFFIRRLSWLITCHLCSTLVRCYWRISILIIIPNRCYSLTGPICYRSAAVLLDCGQPCSKNFDFFISIEVIWMKSYVDGLFNPTGVPVWVTINKLNLALN